MKMKNKEISEREKWLFVNTQALESVLAGIQDSKFGRIKCVKTLELEEIPEEFEKIFQEKKWEMLA